MRAMFGRASPTRDITPKPESQFGHPPTDQSQQASPAIHSDPAHASDYSSTPSTSARASPVSAPSAGRHSSSTDPGSAGESSIPPRCDVRGMGASAGTHIQLPVSTTTVLEDGHSQARDGFGLRSNQALLSLHRAGG
ncbi:hypothetical protein C8Q80DRAFT_409501 [Daedaleopsis nitida]|nr:hypothetical protein C8Q80DRAFT_409501 [Daedaleopsis nitida]